MEDTSISYFWSCCVCEWKTNLKKKCYFCVVYWLNPQTRNFTLLLQVLYLCCIGKTSWWNSEFPSGTWPVTLPRHVRRDQPQATKLSQISQPSCTCMWSKHVKGFSLQQPATLPSVSLTQSSSVVVVISFFIINLLFIKHNYRGVIEIIADTWYLPLFTEFLWDIIKKSEWFCVPTTCTLQ